MKKISKILVFLLCVFLLVGCSGEKGSDGKKPSYVINLAHVEPEKKSLHVGAVEFKKYVEEATDGDIQVYIYPNGQLGGDRQAIESVALGTLDMTIAGTANMSAYDPAFNILEFPYLYVSREECDAALDGEVGEYLSKKMPKGTVLIGFNSNGLRQTTNDKHPIEKLEDFKGLKIRVMENPVYIDMMQILGANPTPIGFDELYTALQQGVVDGQENAFSQSYESRFFEVQKYYSKTAHVYHNNIIIANEDFLNSLPEDYRNLVLEGARKMMIEKQRKLEEDSNDKYERLTAEAGMLINDISPEELDRIREAMKPLYEKYAPIVGEDTMKVIDKYINRN